MKAVILALRGLTDMTPVRNAAILESLRVRHANLLETIDELVRNT